MAIVFNPYPYQQQSIDWVLSHLRCGLFLDMGLGKSVITLTAVQQLLDDCEVSKILVVAPKKVAETTWTSEAAKWTHLRGLRVSRVLGTEKKRIEALRADSDIYVIGRDNFAWLFVYCKGELPFDMIVIDELSSFKTPTSKRFKAMRRAAAGVQHFVGLTGTPAPNGLIDLWAQIYCIDLGARLGKSFQRYRDTYFDIYKHNGRPVRCTARPGSDTEIRAKLEDICLTMKAEDYLSLPPKIVQDVMVELPAPVRKVYDDFARERVLELQQTSQEDGGGSITAASAAGLFNKLAQFANGAVYDQDRTVHEVHSEKIESLVEIIEGAQGESVLVFYQFKHDIDRILGSLKGYRTRIYKEASDLDDWNAGKIDVLLAHPASTAYGLNMQQGGHYIVWFGVGWDLELYQQANARLYRQGQQKPVTIYRLLCADTIDVRAAASLEGKQTTQQKLLDALAEITKKYAS